MHSFLLSDSSLLDVGPTLIWSDNGTNFLGAHTELKQFIDFLLNRKTQRVVSEFCTCQ